MLMLNGDDKLKLLIQLTVTGLHSGFGGLRVACWPLVPKFGFFRAKKSSARLPSERK
jgi:hypothetical protein